MNDSPNRMEYPGPEKTGTFIRFLRVSHNLTQEELGDKIYVTRKAVSKWENGICYPSIDLIPRIADLFGVSFEEILFGEFRYEEENDLNTFDYVIKVFKNKHIKTVITSTAVVLVFCLLTFFFENYNATKIYDVFYEDEDLYVDKGIIITTRSKQYFNFGSIKFDEDDLDESSPVNYRLYVIDDKENEDTLASFSMNNTPYYRNVDYKELTRTNITKSKNKIMLNINYVNEDQDIVNKDVQLSIKLRYKSNDLLQFKREVLVDYLNVDGEALLSKINFKRLKTIDNQSIIDISWLYSLSEEEKLLRFNSTKDGLKVTYKNKILKITDGVQEISIDFFSDSYYMKNKLTNTMNISAEHIDNQSINLDKISSKTKTTRFINLLEKFFNNYA